MRLKERWRRHGGRLRQADGRHDPCVRGFALFLRSNLGKLGCAIIFEGPVGLSMLVLDAPNCQEAKALGFLKPTVTCQAEVRPHQAYR